jgi:hypothetical protein
MKIRHFFQQLDETQVLAAIRAAEEKTTSPIHVFISHRRPKDIMAAAQKEFVKLGLAKLPGLSPRSPDKSGAGSDAVLIYVAPKEHKFAMIGGQAVHQQCGDEFWQSVTAEMSGHFRAGRFTEGVTHGVAKAGDLLAKHFPRSAEGTSNHG